MKDVVKKTNSTSENIVMETLFSYLDKGIDDMEAGRVHIVDEAFEIIKDRIKRTMILESYYDIQKGKGRDCNEFFNELENKYSNIRGID